MRSVPSKNIRGYGFRKRIRIHQTARMTMSNDKRLCQQCGRVLLPESESELCSKCDLFRTEETLRKGIDTLNDSYWKGDLKNVRCGMKESMLSLKNMLQISTIVENSQKDKERYSVFTVEFFRTYAMGLMTMIATMFDQLDSVEARMDELLKEKNDER